VGGGQLIDAAQLLVVQPVLWAALIGLSLNALAVPLPGSVAAVSAALAPANKPLMLLSAGMMLQLVPPQPRQVGLWVYGNGLWVFGQHTVVRGCIVVPATQTGVVRGSARIKHLCF
jgi:hypothetical protein